MDARKYMQRKEDDSAPPGGDDAAQALDEAGQRTWNLLSLGRQTVTCVPIDSGGATSSSSSTSVRTSNVTDAHESQRHLHVGFYNNKKYQSNDVRRN